MVRKRWWDTAPRPVASNPASSGARLAAVGSQVEQIATEIEALASEVGQVLSLTDDARGPLSQIALIKEELNVIQAKVDTLVRVR